VEKSITITTNTGRTFMVLRLAYGSPYGRGATWDKQEDGVTFFDMTSGQGTPGTYYVSTILDGSNGGLCLHGGVPAWDIDANAMSKVRAWLRYTPTNA
jgi:hypothetical protein